MICFDDFFISDNALSNYDVIKSRYWKSTLWRHNSVISNRLLPFAYYHLFISTDHQVLNIVQLAKVGSELSITIFYKSPIFFWSDQVNLTCTPFDTIKTRYQIRDDTSMVNMTKQLYATEGVRGLYKGIIEIFSDRFPSRWPKVSLIVLKLAKIGSISGTLLFDHSGPFQASFVSKITLLWK